MRALHEELNRQIDLTRLALDEARREGDHYLADIRTGELETLHRLAADNGLSLEVAPD